MNASKTLLCALALAGLVAPSIVHAADAKAESAKPAAAAEVPAPISLDGEWQFLLKPDEDAADALGGGIVTVDASQLPPAGEGEVYLFQLEGLEVKTDLGRSLGRVKDVMTTGAAPILVVHDGARERLLPMSPDVLVAVDLEDRTVVVRMLPGLDEL